MSRLYSIGEALIDFTVNNGVYVPHAGGAPANVCACVSKLGGSSAIITQLGEDGFAEYITNELKNCRVDTSYVFRTDKAPTALAFVSISQSGERSFTFYRSPSADMLLSKEQVSAIDINAGDVLHFCSVDLVDYPVKEAHKTLIEKASRNGAIISFDPNLRYNLWDSKQSLINTVKEFLPLANVVKLSDEELSDLFPSMSEEEASKTLLGNKTKLVVITKGSKGATAYFNDQSVSVDCVKVDAVDTTGAGDSFIGAFLSKVLIDGKLILDKESIKRKLEFASKVSAITVTRFGAIPAMPTIEEIKE